MMSNTLSTEKPSPTPSGKPVDAATTCSALVPPPPRRRRSVRNVVPGWPQAAWVLTCGHKIIVPTWDDGITNPQPKKKLYICHKCEKREWSKWYREHGERWYDSQNVQEHSALTESAG